MHKTRYYFDFRLQKLIFNNLPFFCLLVPPSQNKICKTPDYVAGILICVGQESFINCPSSLYNESSECKLTKIFVENHDKCGIKVGNFFVIDYRFWLKEWKEEMDSLTSTTTLN